MRPKALTPADYRLVIKKQMETRAFDDALTSCKQACEQFPNNRVLLLRLAKAHTLLGELADATVALEKSKAKGLPDDKYFKQKLNIIWAANEYANYIATGQEMRRVGQEITVRISRNMIKCYYMLEDWTQAENEADIMLAQSVDPAFSNYKIIAALMADDLGNPIGVLKDKIFGPQGNPFMAKGVLTVHMHMDEDADALLDIAQRMTTKWPGHPAIAELVAELEKYSNGKPAIQNEHLRTGSDVIDDSENIFAKHPEVAEPFKGSLAPDMFSRDLVVDIASKDILISPRGDSDTVALVFLGAGDGAMGPIQLFDSYLATAGITAVYIRDFNRLIFTNGVKSLGGDIESSVTGLRKVLKQIGGAKKIIAIGFSGGGMGALNIGIEMDADRIICFSTPTNVNLAVLDTLGDTRAPIFQSRLNKLSAKEYLDVKEQIVRHKYEAPIELYYSRKVAIDRAHAENLGGIPNVKTLQFDTKLGHNTLMSAIATGWLGHILSGEISGFNGQMRPGFSA